jgi:uncharacterized protein (DUF2252 family)
MEKSKSKATGTKGAPSPAKAPAAPAKKGAAANAAVTAAAQAAPTTAVPVTPTIVLDDALVQRSAEYAGAWPVEPPTGYTWTPRPWVHPSERQELGRVARKRVPRTSHAAFEPKAGRDPIAILEKQEEDRLPDLIPLRHARMADSPFSYYRGTPAVMAFDLATTPRTDIIVQASGDAHLSNFGIFASPERVLVFDANDFDETLPAPWEWDVKRLAASMVIAGRANGFTAAQNRASTMATVRSYREWMARFAGMGLLEMWYSHITEADIMAAAEPLMEQQKVGATRRARLTSIFSKARGKDQLKAASALTTLVDGRRVVVDDPPVVSHVEIPGGPDALRRTFEDYRATMAESRREFLERYRFSDFALKVVGVGSVGTRCFVMILEGRDENDPLILQAKEATASVLEEHVAGSAWTNHGERVVVGQRLMQATPDIFLGWTRGPGGRDYYLRQLWDMKGSVDTSVMLPPGMAFYGGLCAWALARAHARSGDAVAISSYLGTTDTFDGAIADFSEAYADQNAKDHQSYVAAIKMGRVSTTTLV